MTHRILVLNGPNLNLLGTREPGTYGTDTLDDILRDLRRDAGRRGAELQDLQSNHEGALVDALHDAHTGADGVVLNAGAFTHTSLALHDAIAGIAPPVVETHISNVHAREAVRHTSMIAPACLGVVSGFGRDSYAVALDALLRHLGRRHG
jgi:3-dehydroquinate dehydratase-2